jgi:hypothetical protein
MTLNELIEKLEKIKVDGWGELEVAVLIKTTNYAPGIRGALLKDASMGDIGGWGNYTVYLETHEELRTQSDEEE